MLKSISIKNFAIIDELNIDFDDCFTVITGKTGAGKSLIIDAIRLLMGHRAESHMIRSGCNKSYLIGIFSITNNVINEILINNNIPCYKNITIYREISLNGKNLVKINDCLSNIHILNKISYYLCNIHTQYDTFKLINPDTYLSFIDNIDDKRFNEYLSDYKICLFNYKSSLNKYNELLDKVNDTNNKLEELSYIKKELSNLDLSFNIDNILEEDILKISNYDKIFKSLTDSYNYLNTNNVSDNIYNSYKSLETINEYDKKYLVNSNKLKDIYYNISDIISDLYSSINSLDYNSDLLDKLESRLNEINRVKKKYKMDVDGLINYLDSVNNELELIDNLDSIIKDEFNNLTNNYNKLINLSKDITNIRKNKALDIEKSIINECHDLELNDINFKIVFNEINYDDILNSSIFNDNGVDTVSFMISFNKGEKLKPLYKVASGGELSRIMLAFKSYFASFFNLSLIVFDEIDTGLSGEQSLKMANMMKHISEYCQVITITHQAIVASKAYDHFYIYKEVYNNRTVSKIRKLEYKDRIQKLAYMYYGDSINEQSLFLAKMMLDNNKK